MVIVASSILVTLALAYAVTIVRLRNGFVRLCAASDKQPAGTGRRASVSVVVPARNEEASISDCLRSIFANRYPSFDVVLVDDGSTDNTAAIAAETALELDVSTRFRSITLEQDRRRGASHKKRAIETGIRSSSGEIILCTDADTVVGPEWIGTIAGCFDRGIDIVSGPVVYSTFSSFLGGSTALEMLGLVAVGAGGIANGRPNMCNGANLAYRRDAFERVEGFKSIDHISSGDDVLLMLKMAHEDPSAVAFCADPDASVTTRPADGLATFIQQRLRWASKGLSYGDARVSALAILVYVFHAGLLVGAIASFFWPDLLWTLLVALALKLLSEGMLLSSATSHFGYGQLMRYFLPAQLVQIPYVVVIGFLGVFGPGFVWKGRSLQQ